MYDLLKSKAGRGLSREAMDFRTTSSLGMTRNPETVGLGSSDGGVLDFRLPKPFNDLIPGIGIVQNWAKPAADEYR